MPSSITRKSFLKTIAVGGAGLYIPRYLQANWQPPNELYRLSGSLLAEWSAAILKLQVTDKSNADQYGGIISPDTGKVPGRCGDSIYPFFCMAQQTGQQKYIDAAQLVYQWMETHVSDTDGAWLNEPQKNSWKGITVFTTIAICETLKHHRQVIPPAFYDVLVNRVRKSAEYIHTHFTIDYGNINYPISGAYALALAGLLLDVPKWKEKGKVLAQQSLGFISKKDKLIFGEGQPYYEVSKKGCLPVDLGYNVEESLPALVQYGRLVMDDALLDQIEHSMQAHLEFMLPDGAWDNSWGTRIYKWTYWGSRTSDGCQTAYALMRDRDPRFYTAALKNLQLLKQCTVEGLLQGGPHLRSHGIATNVHHTFCHMKALANVLNYTLNSRSYATAMAPLPRATAKGIHFFSDIQTWLVAIGAWRATVTGYDREYKDFKNGHPTGGAISLLWHDKVGAVLVASMNEYQLFEKDNMQPDTDPLSMPLTPRIEIETNTGLYNCNSDLSATVNVKEENNDVVVNVSGHLVNGKQEHPSQGAIPYQLQSVFTADKVMLKFACQPKGQTARIVMPVICRSDEKIELADNNVRIHKSGAVVQVDCDQPMQQLPTANGRIFNFVPGMEAVPLGVIGNTASFVITVN